MRLRLKRKLLFYLIKGSSLQKFRCKDIVYASKTVPAPSRVGYSYGEIKWMLHIMRAKGLLVYDTESHLWSKTEKLIKAEFDKEF